jgi:hypothetical protein
MTLRRILTTAIVAAAAALPAAAQRPQIITDKAPSAIVPEPGSSRLHVLTAGVDRNFNGALELDSGDVAPRWFVIDSDTDQKVDSLTFDAFFNSFPIRVGLDPLGRRLYVPIAGRVRSYDIGTLDLLDDTVALGAYSGVSFEPRARLLFAHMRPGFTTPGYVRAINPINGDTLGTYATGINPQMSISAIDPIQQSISVFTLSEGSFGAPNAMLSVAGGNPDIYASINAAPLELGASSLSTYRANTPTTITLIAVRDSDLVRVIDTRTHRVSHTIEVDAPTSVSFDTTANGSIVVGTAGGMIYRYRAYDASLRDSFQVAGAVGASTWSATLGAFAVGTSSVVIFDARDTMFVDTIDVGATPSRLFFDADGDLHAIGHADDSTGWWRVYDAPDFTLGGTRTLAGFTADARVAYDRLTDSLLTLARGATGVTSLVAYGVNDPAGEARAIFRDTTTTARFTHVVAGPEHYLLIEQRTPTQGFVRVIERASGEQVVHAIAGQQIVDAAFVSRTRNGAHAVYVLANGSANATVSLLFFNRNLLGSDTLGSGANHLLALENGTDAVVTMNGNHSVVGVSLQEGRITQRIPTGTTGFDGPREAIEIIGGIGIPVAVTTYAGDVRLIESDVPYRIEATGGKSEGLARVGNRLYVANAFTPTYAADSTVVIIDLTPSGVDGDETLVASLDGLTPNPATDRVRARFTTADRAHVRVEIRTLAGALVGLPVDRVMESGSHVVELHVAELPSGTYLATLRAGASIASRVLQVIR